MIAHLDEKKIAEKALVTYGYIAQRLKTAEEAVELNQAILKRYVEDMTTDPKQRHPMADSHIVEEIADVLIMCEQMCLHLGRDRIERAVHKKLDKLNNRIEKDLKEAKANHFRNKIMNGSRPNG